MLTRTRVLVTDDSAFMRKMLSEILSGDPAIEIVGQARNGEDAVRKVGELKPDVVTMDVEMPVMDGLQALTRIMQERPTPVVMVSSVTQKGAEMTLRCLDAGAVDFVGKPSGSISLDIESVGRDIVGKVKAAAKSRPQALGAAPTAFVPRSAKPARMSNALVIGSSTGGPRALHTLLPALPLEMNVPIVIVQHMPTGFTQSLARRLDGACPYEVREAESGDALQPGVALVAPGGRHLELGHDGRVRLSDGPPVHNVRPAVDVTLASLVRVFGGRALAAALLTGMGEDGARGLKAVRQAGGTTFAEDASTCVVYGMPKAAVELDAVDHLLPLTSMGSAIAQTIKGSPSRAIASLTKSIK